MGQNPNELILRQSTEKSILRIQLRPGVFVEPGKYRIQRIQDISQETRVELRSSFIDVVSTLGGTLSYSDEKGREHSIDICLQVTQRNGINSLRFSAEMDGIGFTHLPMHTENKQVASTLLGENLDSFAQSLRDSGVEITGAELFTDVLSLYRDLGGQTALQNPS